MKISEIRDEVFGTSRDWSAYGFERMPDYANLFTNAAWPGLIFRRVANVHQAMVFGGVIVGDDDMEVLCASKHAGGVGDWIAGVALAEMAVEFNRSPWHVSPGQTGFFECEGFAGPLRDGDGQVRGSTDILIVPEYAMAVVSNISMLGFRSKKAVTKASFFNDTFSISNRPGGNFIPTRESGQLAHFYVMEPLTQYLVQWAEIPFAQNGGDFVRKAVPSLVTSYPSKVQSQMSKVLDQVASDPTMNPDSASTFVLSRVTTSKSRDAVWGGVIRGVYCNPGLEYTAYATVEVAPTEGSEPDSYVRKMKAVEGAFYESSRKTLFVPGDLVVSGGFTSDAMPASLKVASNFVIDMTKFHKEYAPASEVPAFKGEANYSDLINGTALSASAQVNERQAMSSRPTRRRFLEPLGARSVEIDLQNLLNRAEAIVMDEKIYSAATGSAFGDASGQGSVVAMGAQSTGYVYTKEVAEVRGDKSGKNIGFLVYEKPGEFTVPENGTYEVFIHSNGTELHGLHSAHGIPAQQGVRTVTLSKGAKYTIGRVVGGYDWYCQGHQQGSLWTMTGPNFAGNVLCIDKGTAHQYQITSDKAPTHGLRGENGLVFGTRQQVADGPVGAAVVAIRMISAD